MRILFILLAMTVAARAQQTSTQDLRDIIPPLEAQRNQCLTAQALSEGSNAALKRENDKLKAELDELKKTAK